MSSSYITVARQKAVRERAKNACEYCLAPEEYFYLGSYHIDPIISEKQGGSNELENLALSCPICNRNKGSNLSAYLLHAEALPHINPTNPDPAYLHQLAENQELTLVDCPASIITT